MKSIFKILWFILIIINLGCSISPKENNFVSDSGPTYLDSISCDSSLFLLVHSSNISLNLLNAEVKQDGLDNDTLLIKISRKNEAEPDAMVDAAEGFMCIDLKSGKLYELIIETDSLRKVECDNLVLNHYIKHCIK